VFTIFDLFDDFRPVKFKDDLYIKLFGSNLRELRKDKGLSQEQLAIDADIPINQVGRIERAEINTTLFTMRALSKALDIHISDLFNFEEKLELKTKRQT
jgi:transcriptional regulator with XRE-family HTH domain